MTFPQPGSLHGSPEISQNAKNVPWWEYIRGRRGALSVYNKAKCKDLREEEPLPQLRLASCSAPSVGRAPFVGLRVQKVCSESKPCAATGLNRSKIPCPYPLFF